MEYKILIAEDDNDIIEVLKMYLENEGFITIIANNGEEAYNLLQTTKVDLAIVDVMMPKMNGYELTKKIRNISNIPVIILSAKNMDSDKIIGLNLGADDYLTKPFNPLEVIARVKAALRRFYSLNNNDLKDKNICKVGDLELHIDTVSLYKKGEYVNITLMEFKILSLLMKSPGKIFTKNQIYETISGVEYFESDDNTMMVHISKLREKIEDDTKYPKYIKTVRGLGYKIDKE